MNIRIVGMFILLVFSSSCLEKIIDEPENLIPKDKMAGIYYDLSLVTAAKNTNNVILIKHNIEAMNFIFTKYEIDSIQFVQSDLFYASRPAIYKEIYENVETRIKNDIKKIEDVKNEKRKQDSIEAVKNPKKIDSLKTN